MAPSKIHPVELQAATGREGEPRNVLRRLSKSVDRGLTGLFSAIGSFCARRPWTVIVACLVVTGLCMIGFIKFAVETDGDYLYTPLSAPSRDDKSYVVENFGFGNNRVTILATSRSKNKENVLTKPRLLELLALFDSVSSNVVKYKGTSYRLIDYCTKEFSNSTTCVVDSVLSAWNFSRPILEADPDIIATLNNPANRASYGQPLSLNYLLGGVQRDSQGRVTSAEVTQLVFALQYNPVEIKKATYDPVARKWEEDILRLAVDDWHSDQLRLFVANAAAVDLESSNAINKDIGLLAVGYILICLYTYMALWRNSWAYQKVHVAGFSLLAIGLAVGSTIGLLSGCGILFNLVTQTLPYLLVGLGVDDTFVIIGSYFHQDPNQPVQDKIAAAMGHAGASITVTSATNFISFAINIYSDLPALRDFSVYAAIGIFFIFVYQLLFFPAWLALDARREERARLGAPWAGLRRLRPTDDEETSTAVAPVAQDGMDSSPTPVSKAKQELADLPTTTPRCIGNGSFDPAAPTLPTRIVSEWLPKVVLHPAGKVVVLIIEMGLLAGAIYGCTKAKMDFRYREWFTPDGSYLHEAFAIQREYFGGDATPWSLYTKAPKDGRDYFYHQDTMLTLIKELGSSHYVAKLPPVSSWYLAYLGWLASSPHAGQLDSQGRPSTQEQFNAWLDQWLAGPGNGWAEDIRRSGSGPNATIITTRLAGGLSGDIQDGSYAVRYVRNLRKLADKYGDDLDAFAYDGTFLFYDGYGIIVWQTVRNVIIAGAVVFAMTLLLLADFGASLLVGTMVVLCDVMLFGFMWYVDLTFNTVTSIVLVLAVGIAVDYPAHIMRSYLSEKGTYHDRALKALQDIGGEVLNGAFTTWLGIVVMGAAVHYIFRTFFKLFFALIVLALWHGVVLMPVLLSIWGPASYAT